MNDARIYLVPLLAMLASGCGNATEPDPTQVGTASSALVQLSGDHCVPLIVNQTIDAGTVCATIDGADIKVEFMADNGWLIKDARLWIGLDLADMPQDANHDPILAEMPLQSGWLDPLVSTYEFRVPLSQFGVSPDDYICDPKRIYLVPKAAMLDANYTFGIAWGGDTLMGTWSRYFDVELTCYGQPPPTTCETAFAYGGRASTCFIDLPGINPNRWGWTIGPLGPGSYVFDIYAGAGQCDLSKGAFVGNLTVAYDNAVASVCYAAAPGAEFEETHLYVGHLPLPLDKKDNPTVAPGLYPLSGSGGLDVPSTGNIYVGAHAKACYSEEMPPTYAR